MISTTKEVVFLCSDVVVGDAVAEGVGKVCEVNGIGKTLLMMTSSMATSGMISMEEHSCTNSIKAIESVDIDIKEADDLAFEIKDETFKDLETIETNPLTSEFYHSYDTNGSNAYQTSYGKSSANFTETSYGKSSKKAKKYSDYQWYENEVDVTQKASRSKNKISPNSNAAGNHVVYKKDPVTGKITNYKVYEVNPRNPTGFDEVIGNDAIGSPHTNPVTLEDLMPHVHDKTVPGKVREPLLDEIPE